jgi:glutathione synthetase
LESGPLFARLVQRVSQDVEYINWALKSVSDPFTVRLLSILNAVASEGIRQPVAMGIHRSDYMIHEGQKLQQIEINTISSAFGALSHRMSHLHTHMIQNWANYKNGVFEEHLSPTLVERKAIPNPSLDEIAELFDSALTVYCTSRHVTRSHQIAILMIVQPGERNSVDQRWLQYRMEEKHSIHVLRHCLSYVNKHATLDEQNQVLSLDGYEIAVAYYRAGYTPTDYPSEAEWEARLKVERSVAIKCPNIAYHLAGTKKMQQVWALPGQVEKFLTEQTEADAVRACFAGLFSLTETDDPSVHQTIANALANPHNYVMKPQREGGGNLLANEEMIHALRTMSPTERADYILMERIIPETHRTILSRDSQFVITNCIAELGVYCTILADSNGEIVNKCGGWLLRSKPDNVEDGGVAAGRAYLDSPYLY